MITQAMARQAAAAVLALAGWHGAAQAAGPAPTPAVADFNRCEKPVWPQDALRREQQGTVTMAFRIGADGSVVESKVTKSSGYPLLDEAARFGIAKCKFKPATLNGKPQSSWMRMQYVWTLDHSANDPALQAAFASTLEAAEAGDVAAQRKLGELYRSGKGVQPDNAQALQWLSKAADAGDAEAQYLAALLLLPPQGGPADAVQAHQWLLKAAVQGHAMAMVLLAAQYSNGNGVDKDSEQAYAWLRKAADAGTPRAYVGLAWMYQTGQGVDRNPDEALRMLRQGAELGDAHAILGLGAELFRSQSPRDHAEAVPLLAQAAGKGNPHAQALLGQAYREGRGVPADVAAAAEWFRKAAAQSHVEAQFALAEMLEQGSGVRKDEAEALRLYELAAGRGWAPALRRLITVSERGELGRPVDVAAAAHWRARLPATSAR
ncbi:hypothetical protein ASC94_02615 [Massilia sp. Root418]|uniref:TonB family protein n=1 Tax=Massilia sp. Root418 TaxID=1736532 RepID=UPI0006FE19FC|nr:TonB family protein [Massilia sp. Root418]KQX01531.1 hypothetical protein ASC94_02615 [Massilia sp. Root418]